MTTNSHSKIRDQMKYNVCGPGRALYAHPAGTLYQSCHLNIQQSKDEGQTWQRILSIPRPFQRRVIEPVRLLCRLFRHEVRGLIPLPGGEYVATTRTGVFWAQPGEKIMQPAKIDAGRIPVKWPMTISLGPDRRILWGEYWGNNERRKVRIFASDDCGRSFYKAYAFSAGATRHVHNILYDTGLDKYWIFCGDHGTQPGIGLLDRDFRRFEWVAKGQQKFRAVCAFDMGSRLVYATDTEMERNGIYALDKSTGKVEHISPTDGSCIYATQCGEHYVIATTAEPLKNQTAKNKGNIASIWISKDAFQWHKILTFPKDVWSYKYFQFGSLVLPRGRSNRNVLMFSGQALRSVDGKIYTASLAEDER